MTRKILILSLLALAAASPTIAQSQNNVLVLVPVFFSGPGALGSQWNTQLTILNNSDNPLTSIPYLYPCPIPEGCLGAIPPHASIALRAVSATSTGFFYSVRADELPQTVFSLRVFDQSQATADYGTEIPVVTSSAFREDELQFLDVPADPNFRITLRVYALPGNAPMIRVRAFEEPQSQFGSPQSPSVLIAERVFALNPTTVPMSVTIQGPSLVINDALGIHSTNSDKRYRFTVQSTTPGVPIWALVTVTNNQTQRVTAIAPK